MYYKYLVIIIILFLLGSWGIILNRGHFIIMLVSIELVLLSTFFFFFLISSKEIDLLIEQIFMIMGLTIAAAESSIGLAILVAYYRIRGTIVLKSFSSLRG